MKKSEPLGRVFPVRSLLKIVLVMKLAVFFIFLTAFQVHATAVMSQKINLECRNAEIRSALASIEKQSGIRFMYNYELQDLKIKVSLKARNVSVPEALDDLFTGTSLTYKKVNDNLIAIFSNIKSDIRDVRIYGRVTDNNGTPLAGVSVIIKGTTRGTVTDIEGNYSFLAPDANVTLVFSSVGYETVEMPTNGNIEVNVVLTAIQQSLDQVVVIGYGTQKKSVVTGAISSVKASDIEDMPISRIEQALQGRVSGVTIAANSGQPGEAATVRIRGTTSINNSDPLYVVDGLPITGGIENINQSDIESIEVLKDAASAAIYGTRAASGVILITTKKGKQGRAKINYNGYYGTQSPAKKLDLLNATEYATVMNEASVAAGKNILFPDPAALGEGTDWQEVIFNKNAKIQNHEINISGGNDVSKFFTSFGYYDQEGIVATDISRFKRYSIRLNTDHRITDWLSLGNNLSYAHIKNKGIGNTNNEFGGVLSSALNLDPITPVVETDPAKIAAPPYSNHKVFGDANGNPYGISTLVMNEMVNPYAYILARDGSYGYSDNIIGNAYVDIKPIKGLTFRSSLGGKLAYWGGEYFTPIAFYNSSNETRQNSFVRETSKGLSWNWENTLSYNKIFGQHNITALVGTGAFSENSSGVNAVYMNLPVSTFDNAQMNSDNLPDERLGGRWTDPLHNVSSIFGRLIYNYDEKYLFTGILRRDGSSRFGTNNKYGNFPSLSLGWVVSRENFWENIHDAISFFKIRGSYGVTGNDNIGNFRYLSTIGSARNYLFGFDNYLVGYSPDAPSNPDLKWEQTSQSNLGFEMNFLKGFTMVFDIYNKNTTGMLRPIIIPGYIGAAGNPIGNVASMTNKGFELELGYNKKYTDFSYDIKGNVSYLRNEITDLGTVDFLTGATFQASDYEISRLQVGHPIGAFYGFQTLGIFQNRDEVNAYSKNGTLIQPNASPGDFKFADLNNDGKIDAADRTFIGDPTPTWSYGATLNMNYKAFDLTVFGQGAAGNDIFNGLRRLDLPNANWTTAVLNRWTGEGSTNVFPRLINGDPNKNFSSPSTFYLSKGDYFRLKTIQLGYTLPQNLIERAGLSRVRIYFTANNLLTFTSYTGYDPEIGGSSYGIDRGYYPQARAFMIGLNLGL